MLSNSEAEAQLAVHARQVIPASQTPRHVDHGCRREITSEVSPRFSDTDGKNCPFLNCYRPDSGTLYDEITAENEADGSLKLAKVFLV